MISTIGRVLTVLTAMFSIAFMAFAISRWATIPDWASEARQLEDFRVSRTEGETPSWTVVTRRTGDPVATSPNIGEVLEKMYQRGTQDAQEQLRIYQEEIPLLQADIAASQQASTVDSQGVQNLADEMVVMLEKVDAEVNRLTMEAEREKAQAQKLQKERERRRSDVFRLREELEEVQADGFRAEQLQQELTDMLRRLQGSVVKLQVRQQQLQQSVQQ